MRDIIRIVEAVFGKEPKFTVKAQFERSLVQLAIDEKKAKLETFRAQETEFRAVLVAAYGNMAYEAERCKFKLETRVWEDGASLENQNDLVNEALEAHNACIELIQSTERSIEDDENELADAELWEQVSEAVA